MVGPTPDYEYNNSQHYNNYSLDTMTETNESQYVFPTGTHTTFPLVRGQRRHGFLVDAGPSQALMGIYTFGNYQKDVLRPQGHEKCNIHKSSNRFSGIGGKRQSSRGICILPLGLGLAGVKSVELGVDLIGGQGSFCPGLFPLHVLITWKTVILCGVLHTTMVS